MKRYLLRVRIEPAESVAAVVAWCVAAIVCLASCEQGTTPTDDLGRPAVSQWDTVAPWRTYQRDGSRSAFVPVTLDPSEFEVQWSTKLGSNYSLPNILRLQPTSDGQRVFIPIASPSINAQGPASIVALDIETGGIVWERVVPLPGWISGPGVHGDTVFFQSTRLEGHRISALSALNGADIFDIELPYKNASPVAPMVASDLIVAGGHGSGGGVSILRLDGTEYWGGFHLGMPAVEGDRIFMSRQTERDPWMELRELSTARLIVRRQSVCDCSIGPTALGAGRAYFLGSGTLYALNATSLETEWSIPTNHVVAVAVTDDRVFVTARGTVVEVEAGSGRAVKTWHPSADDPELSSITSIVATHNLLLVATTRAIHVIDRATFEQVWRFDQGGGIALSTGLLLINGVDGTVTGVRLGG